MPRLRLARWQMKQKKPDRTYEPRYFNDASLIEPGAVKDIGVVSLTGKGWGGSKYGFWGIFPNAPVWLPLASLAAMIVVRFFDAWGKAGHPWALASMFFALSAWLGLASSAGLLMSNDANRSHGYL